MTYDFDRMSDQHRNSVIDIFNHYVLTSFAAYPATPLSYDFFDRFMEMSQGYPALVVKQNTGGIVGFGFLHPFHFAKTFNSAAETTTSSSRNTLEKRLEMSYFPSLSRRRRHTEYVRFRQTFHPAMSPAYVFT
jgi:L-amino acid N-acyltransferase YncA